MDKSKALSAKKRIKDLEIKKAYAEYKIRHTGDLNIDLDDWVSNITELIAVKKGKK